MSNRIAFNTANLVGRFTGYRFELKHWGEQHALTVARMNDAEWATICREIADAGFHAAELWVALADPAIGERAARQYRKIADDLGIALIGLGATPTEANFKLCEWIGIDGINGSLGNCDLASVKSLTRATDIRYNFENHPEKSAREIVDKIAGGDDLIGVCIDTGWLGTHGVDAPSAIRELGPLVRHVHVKDVRAPGGHETTPLGQGCVDLEGVMRTLSNIGYAGRYSWEDEPEDRNPFDVAVQSREWLEARVKS